MPEKRGRTSPAAGRTRPESRPRQLRCFTRAVKNARFLQEHDPDTFAQEDRGPGLGTGLPVEILHRLHVMPADAPELEDHPAVRDFLRNHPFPKVRKLGDGSPT